MPLNHHNCQALTYIHTHTHTYIHTYIHTCCSVITWLFSLADDEVILISSDEEEEAAQNEEERIKSKGKKKAVDLKELFKDKTLVPALLLHPSPLASHLLCSPFYLQYTSHSCIKELSPATIHKWLLQQQGLLVDIFQGKVHSRRHEDFLTNPRLRGEHKIWILYFSLLSPPYFYYYQHLSSINVFSRSSCSPLSGEH